MSPRSCYASHISGNIERKQRTQMAQWVKNLPAMQKTQETWVSIPGLGRSPGKRNSNPLQYFLPEKSHGQRILVGYSPWGHKESDMFE